MLPSARSGWLQNLPGRRHQPLDLICASSVWSSVPGVKRMLPQRAHPIWTLVLPKRFVIVRGAHMHAEPADRKSGIGHSDSPRDVGLRVRIHHCMLSITRWGMPFESLSFAGYHSLHGLRLSRIQVCCPSTSSKPNPRPPQADNDKI